MPLLGGPVSPTAQATPTAEPRNEPHHAFPSPYNLARLTLRITRRAAPLLLMTAGVSAVGCMRLLGGALHTHNLWSYLFITPVFSVIGQGIDISEIN
jgi:hypothetical protein